MANEIKKYLSLEGLQEYDAKRKAQMEAADEAVLEAAKTHAEGLADNYDPAGTAQTKVNELADGQVKTNKEAIDAINDAENGILKQAKDYADGKDAAIQSAADAAASAQEAADAAQEAADAAQADVDALTAADGKVTVLEGKVEALIAGTYDDTEVRDLIKTNADDIDTLEGRADALEDTVGVLVGDDADKSVRTIANEELAKQLIADNAAESLDTLEEIAAWIQSHPGDAAAMNKAITDLEALVGTLPEDVTATTVVGYVQELIAAEKARAEGAEGALSDRLDAVEEQLGVGGEGENTVDARIAAAKEEAISTAAGDATAKADKALADAKDYVDGEIDKVEETIDANGEAITALDGRVGANEDAIGEIETSLAEGGATANAIAEAKKAGTDAQDAVTALAEGEVAALRSEVDALNAVNFVEITSAEIDAMFA